jgi:hypothetical protein
MFQSTPPCGGRPCLPDLGYALGNSLCSKRKFARSSKARGPSACTWFTSHFRVDVLFPIETTEASLSFIGSFPHLTTPHFDQRIFDNYMGRMEPNYLDISHWLDELAHDLGRPEADPGQPASSSPELNPYGLVHWTQGDPLEDVLLATFGAYPPPMGIGRDYVRFIIDNLRSAIYDAKIEESIPLIC